LTFATAVPNTGARATRSRLATTPVALPLQAAQELTSSAHLPG
jgi:hypothetical protein